MARVKTSELTGAALDWAVLIIEGYVQPDPIDFARHHFKPSTNWSQGGPILDKSKITLIACDNDWEAQSPTAPLWCLEGPTPLIAVCRCYVTSELGEEIEIPDELLKGNENAHTL